MTLSGDGKTLALLCAGSRHVIVRSLEGKEEHELVGPSGLQTLALSSDGRWLAMGASRVVQVWDVAAARLIHTLNDCSAPVVFSPDGQWLATSSRQHYHLWRTGSWVEGPDLGRHRSGIGGLLAFSPDGDLLAVAFSNTEVDLRNSHTGELLARLEAPEAALLADLAFSPRGGRLAVATQNQLVHLWDLRQLRSQLAEMALDWELPGYPPPPDYSEPLRLLIRHGKKDA
jgi:WD40 repeat protein